jgi:FkbM family methyltransferase
VNKIVDFFDSSDILYFFYLNFLCIKASFMCRFLAFCIMIASTSLFSSYIDHDHPKVRGEGSYLSFANKISKNEIQTIFEIGSRDAKDAVELSDYYRCHVFAFECNPDAIAISQETMGTNPNVTLIPYGVWDTPGVVSFYRVIDGNIGASSFFPFNPKAKNYPDILAEGLQQQKIDVETVRLDDFMADVGVDSIDLLCMDVQEAAMQVLRSLGGKLRSVKYIIVELETHPIYLGETLYKDVDRFLKRKGFIRASDALDKKGLFGDVLYVRDDVYSRMDKKKRNR